MQCISCHNSIKSAEAGFVVCEHCGKVNISQAIEAPTIPKKHRLTIKWVHRKFNRMFVWAATALVLVTVVTCVLVIRQQTEQEPATDTKVVIKTWKIEEMKLQEAQGLFAEGKLDEAGVILSQIDSKYPNYKSVTTLQKDIENRRLELDKKAAEEQAKISTDVSKTVPTKQTPKPASPTFSTSIQIRGDTNCQASTLEALKLLSTRAPSHYATITQYISIIECAPQGSGMFAYENPPRYLVGDATRNAGTVWYAGTIAHDAGHSKLYRDYLNAHGNVPDTIWIGEAAERACLDAQYDALAKIGATQSQLDYVKNIINSQYYNVPYSQRWW